MAATLHEPKTEGSILARLFDSRRLDLTPEAASFLLSVKVDRADIVRMNHLSSLAQEGSMNPDEEVEWMEWMHTSRLEDSSPSSTRAPAILLSDDVR